MNKFATSWHKFLIIGYYPLGSIANGAIPQQPTFAASAPLAYQAVADPATILAYPQQLQQPQAYLHAYQPNTVYQSQLAQLLALRQAQLAQAQQGQLQAVQPEQVNFILEKKMKTYGN